ncbi:hypothetical protein EDB19DRAFT_1827882 [Suillus lakei]|nr:hypothetical protein EDB19DRAFT_1827882 [Suillus lakei]
MTQAAVQLELAQWDAKELEEGSAISLHAEVTCSVLISMGIDLEDTHLPTQSSGDDSGCPVPDPTSGKAKDFQLLLPSEVCDIVPCNKTLLETEWSLHFAQANDALNNCHSQI